MLSKRPKVGDVIVYTNPQGEKSSWEVTMIPENDDIEVYGTLLSTECKRTYVLSKIGDCGFLAWQDSAWSLDFAQWVLSTQKDHADNKGK